MTHEGRPLNKAIRRKRALERNRKSLVDVVDNDVSNCDSNGLKVLNEVVCNDDDGETVMINVPSDAYNRVVKTTVKSRTCVVNNCCLHVDPRDSNGASHWVAGGASHGDSQTKCTSRCNAGLDCQVGQTPDSGTSDDNNGDTRCVGERASHGESQTERDPRCDVSPSCYPGHSPNDVSCHHNSDSRCTGRRASSDNSHSERDFRCNVNTDCQQDQLTDGHPNTDSAKDPTSDTEEQVAKIEFSDPKVHENTLRIKIGHLSSVALVDTSATLSIISENLLQKLNPRNVTYVKPTVSVVYGVGSQQHEINTKIETDFFIDGHKFTQGFHVMKNQYPVILGLDFLVAHGAEIFFG